MALFGDAVACFRIVAQLGIRFEQPADKNEFIMENQMIFVRVATLNDVRYADEIAKETEESAIARGSGISKRSVESLAAKMREGKAVIAVTGIGEWVGFSYFEVWESGRYISNSGLIVAPKFRNSGVAKAIKERVFRISRRMYPHAKVFSITSGAAIMKLNSRLGFEPVSFADITQDSSFWEGCKSCVNYDILENKKRCNCLCTAMLFDPENEKVALNVEKTVVEQSIMILDCVAYPRHSLVPDATGTDALCTALTDIKWFNEYVFPIEGNLPNPVNMKVSGGLHSFTVEISYDHSYTAKEILNVIKNHTWCKFTIRDEALKLQLTNDVYNDSFVSNNY
ncbi:hypothetical protein D3C87_117210 [compost metagenome]